MCGCTNGALISSPAGVLTSRNVALLPVGGDTDRCKNYMELTFHSNFITAWCPHQPEGYTGARFRSVRTSTGEKEGHRLV